MDRADFFDIDAARRKIKAAQMLLIEECERIVLGKTSIDNELKNEFEEQP